MATVSYLAIIGIFVFYYFLILFFERKIISEPREIIEKFLAVTLCYAGISLIYFALMGKPLFTDDVSEYSIYIFIIGFIAVLWAVPNLMSEFHWYDRFLKAGEKLRRKKDREQRAKVGGGGKGILRKK